MPVGTNDVLWLATVLCLAATYFLTSLSERVPLIRDMKPAIAVFGAALLYTVVWYAAHALDPEALQGVGLTKFLRNGLADGGVLTGAVSMAKAMDKPKAAVAGAAVLAIVLVRCWS